MQNEIRVTFVGDDTDLRAKLRSVDSQLRKLEKSNLGNVSFKKFANELKSVESSFSTAQTKLTSFAKEQTKLRDGFNKAAKSATGFEKEVLKAQAAIAGNKIKQAARDLALLGNRLETLKTEARKAATELAKMSRTRRVFRRLGNAGKGLGGVFSSLAKGALAVVSAVGSIAGAALQIAANFTIVLAGAQQLIQAVGQLSKAFVEAASAGSRLTSGRQLFTAQGGDIQEFRKALQGVVSDADLIKSANLANTFNIPIQKFQQLSKVAQAASIATGDSVKFLLDSIVRGVARASPLILDNLGIVLKIKEANEKWAAANKKTVASMTKVDKAQAVLNATIEAGQKIIKKVTDSGADLAPPVDQLAASVDNLKQRFTELAALNLNNFLDQLTVTTGADSIGDALNTQIDQAFSALRPRAIAIGEFLGSAEGVKALQDTFSELSRLASEGAARIASFFKTIDPLLNVVAGVAQTLIVNFKALVAVVQFFASIAVGVFKLVAETFEDGPIKALLKFNDVMAEAFSGLTSGLGSSVSSLFSGLGRIADGILGVGAVGGAIDEVTEKFEDLLSIIEKTDDRTKQIALSLQAVAAIGDPLVEANKALGQGTTDSIKSIAVQSKEGQQAVVDLSNALDNVSSSIVSGDLLRSSALGELNDLVDKFRGPDIKRVFGVEIQGRDDLVDSLENIQAAALNLSRAAAVGGKDAIRDAQSRYEAAVKPIRDGKQQALVELNLEPQKGSAKAFVDKYLASLKEQAAASKGKFQDALKDLVRIPTTFESSSTDLLLEASGVQQSIAALTEYSAEANRVADALQKLEALRKKQGRGKAAEDAAKALAKQRKELQVIERLSAKLTLDKKLSGIAKSQKALQAAGNSAKALAEGIKALIGAANDSQIQTITQRSVDPIVDSLKQQNEELLSDISSAFQESVRTGIDQITSDTDREIAQLEIQFDVEQFRTDLKESAQALTTSINEGLQGAATSFIQGDFVAVLQAIADAGTKLRQGVQDLQKQIDTRIADNVKEIKIKDIEVKGIDDQLSLLENQFKQFQLSVELQQAAAEVNLAAAEAMLRAARVNALAAKDDAAVRAADAGLEITSEASDTFSKAAKSIVDKAKEFFENRKFDLQRNKEQTLQDIEVIREENVQLEGRDPADEVDTSSGGGLLAKLGDKLGLSAEGIGAAAAAIKLQFELLAKAVSGLVAGIRDAASFVLQDSRLTQSLDAGEDIIKRSASTGAAAVGAAALAIGLLGSAIAPVVGLLVVGTGGLAAIPVAIAAFVGALFAVPAAIAGALAAPLALLGAGFGGFVAVLASASKVSEDFYKNLLTASDQLAFIEDNLAFDALQQAISFVVDDLVEAARPFVNSLAPLVGLFAIAAQELRPLISMFAESGLVGNLLLEVTRRLIQGISLAAIGIIQLGQAGLGVARALLFLADLVPGVDLTNERAALNSFNDELNKAQGVLADLVSVVGSSSVDDAMGAFRDALVGSAETIEEERSQREQSLLNAPSGFVETGGLRQAELDAIGGGSGTGELDSGDGNIAIVIDSINILAPTGDQNFWDTLTLRLSDDPRVSQLRALGVGVGVDNGGS